MILPAWAATRPAVAQKPGASGRRDMRATSHQRQQRLEGTIVHYPLMAAWQDMRGLTLTSTVRNMSP